jgi:hypothetical protein
MEETSISTQENTIEKLKSKNNTIKDYIESLNPIQYKALQISIRELESSFSLEKSIGYIDYVNSLNSINHKNS